MIAEQERNRIGQDLHDTLGHVFASLSVKSELAAKLIDKDPIAAKKEILNINEISKDTLEKVRHIIENLKVQTFEEEIQSIEQFLKDANIHFNFENIRGASSLNPTKQTILSMILREAVNNVIKHAEASEINGKIESYDNGIKLIISDNGIGLKQPSEVKLKSINDRVALLSRTVNITSKQGTTIDIMIPRRCKMISIVIAEDQNMLRKAMIQLIEFHDDLKVIDDFDNGIDALQSINSQQPDIAILDIEIPGMTGLEVLSQLRENKINTKVIIVTTFKRPGYFERAVAKRC